VLFRKTMPGSNSAPRPEQTRGVGAGAAAAPAGPLRRAAQPHRRLHPEPYPLRLPVPAPSRRLDRRSGPSVILQYWALNRTGRAAMRVRFVSWLPNSFGAKVT